MPSPPSTGAVVPLEDHTGATYASGGWWDSWGWSHSGGFGPDLRLLGAAVGSAEVCVLAGPWGGYTPVAAYRLPLEATVPEPEPGPTLPDGVYVDHVAAGPGDTCYAALRDVNGEDSLVYLVGPDGLPDEQFGRLQLRDTRVTSLTPDGDAVWVGGEDAVGGYVRRYTRDGAFDSEVRLPVVPVVLRVLDDGFVVTTWRPDAVWRTDRAGLPLLAFGGDGRVGVPGSNRTSSRDTPSTARWIRRSGWTGC